MLPEPIRAIADQVGGAIKWVDGDIDAEFGVKLVAQQDSEGAPLGRVPSLFLPRTVPFGLIDYELV